MFADGVELLAVLLAAGWVGLVLNAIVDRRTWMLGQSPRATLLLTVGTAVLMFAVQARLADRIHDAGGSATRLDSAVWIYILGHRDSALTELAEVLNTAGGWLSLAVLSLAATGVLVLRRHWVEAAIVLAAPALTVVVGPGSKLGYHRPRPPVFGHLVRVTDSSLPSGHTLDATIVLGVLAVVVASRRRERWRRVVVGVTAATGIVAVGTSRVYLGVHWATDVLAGWALGCAWVAVGAAALSMLRASNLQGPQVRDHNLQTDDRRDSYLTSSRASNRSRARFRA